MARKLHLVPTGPKKVGSIYLPTPKIHTKECERCGIIIKSAEQGGNEDTDSFTEKPDVWENPEAFGHTGWEKCS